MNASLTPEQIDNLSAAAAAYPETIGSAVISLVALVERLCDEGDRLAARLARVEAVVGTEMDTVDQSAADGWNDAMDTVRAALADDQEDGR